MERAAYYGWFAERYGWTQRQVDEDMSHDVKLRLPDFAQLVDEVRDDKARKAKK